MLRPLRLHKSDKVRLIAPSGAVREDKFNHLVEIVRSLDLEPIWTEYAVSRYGYFSAPDSVRVQELVDAFTDTEAKAVFCLRGGYGATRLLDSIPYKVIRRYPKIFLGFSDITALQMAFFKKMSLITLHTSLNALEYDYARLIFRQMVYEARPIELDMKVYFAPEPVVITKGRTRGVLVGGNLSLLVSLIGTGYLPRFTDRVVFIEEISEPPYKIDRMLTHLLMATDLPKAAAIVLGIFHKCEWDNYYENKDLAFSLLDIFKDRFSELGIPIVYGFPLGHVPRISILPMGARVEVDTDDLKIRLLNPIVR